MTLYEAPARSENFAGPRTFAYLAEVDILGWKFRKMGDGGFVIETPRVDDLREGNLVSVLSPGHVELLLALLDLEQTSDPEVPSSWENVGKVVQP